VKAGSEKITCSSDWRRILRENQGGTLNVSVLRDKREQNITVKLPHKQTSDNSFHFDMEQLQNEMNELQPKFQEQVIREIAARQTEFERLKVRMLQWQKEFQQELQSR
jgi:hypothetical protein